MIDLATPRFEDGRPMLLAGLRRGHRFEESGETVTRQWGEFSTLGPIPGRVGAFCYGVSCGADTDAGTFDYMAAVEVEAFDGLPQGVDRMRVPEARYAVFPIPDVAAIQPTFEAIWTRWLPTSGYRNAPSPDFTRYGPGGDLEIWWPVLPA